LPLERLGPRTVGRVVLGLPALFFLGVALNVHLCPLGGTSLVVGLVVDFVEPLRWGRRPRKMLRRRARSGHALPVLVVGPVRSHTRLPRPCAVNVEGILSTHCGRNDLLRRAGAPTQAVADTRPQPAAQGRPITRAEVRTNPAPYGRSGVEDTFGRRETAAAREQPELVADLVVETIPWVGIDAAERLGLVDDDARTTVEAGAPAKQARGELEVVVP